MLRCVRKFFYQLFVAGWDVKETTHLLPMFCAWRTSDFASYIFIYLIHVIIYWSKDLENIHGGWAFVGWGGEYDNLRSNRWRGKLHPIQKVKIKWKEWVTAKFSQKKKVKRQRILVSGNLIHSPKMCLPFLYLSSIKIQGENPLGLFMCSTQNSPSLSYLWLFNNTKILIFSYGFLYDNLHVSCCGTWEQTKFFNVVWEEKPNNFHQNYWKVPACQISHACNL